MKLSKSKLIQLIKEELEDMLMEGDDWSGHGGMVVHDQPKPKLKPKSKPKPKKKRKPKQKITLGPPEGMVGKTINPCPSQEPGFEGRDRRHQYIEVPGSLPPEERDCWGKHFAAVAMAKFGEEGSESIRRLLAANPGMPWAKAVYLYRRSRGDYGSKEMPFERDVAAGRAHARPTNERSQQKLSKLKQIIKEELKAVLNELHPDPAELPGSEP
jgi:hypothetical protein